MSWTNSVGKVFHVHPRVESRSSLWIERRTPMKRLREAMQRPGGHICLDGPSGAGKTSLAWSYLCANRIRHVQVQVTKSMDWLGFCRQLVSVTGNPERSMSSDIEVGIDKGLPIAKLKVSLGAKERTTDSIDLREKLAAQLDEHEIARHLVEQQAALLIDDVERASESLLLRISDLCKVLTQYEENTAAKLLLIGTGDIYQRLYNENPSLDERLVQVSVGGFEDRAVSSLLLKKGFEMLSLMHPWNSLISQQKEQADKCAWTIWEAADGLPKSLNSLGHAISIRSEGRRGVSANDIITAAEKMKEQNWKDYAQRFPEVVSHLYDSPVARKVVRRLYVDGIS